MWGPVTVWRRSILARVVLSTVLLSGVIVGGIGWFLLQQTREGLLDNRLDAVLAQAANETRDARSRLERTPGTETDVSAQRRSLIAPIQQRGQLSGFSVVLAGPEVSSSALSAAVLTYTPDLDVASIPDPLLDHFAEPAAPAWAYSTVRYTDGTPSAPAIVVGSQVRLPADGSTYTLFYVFPLAEDAQTLGLVTRAVTTAGVLVPVLLALVAWAVARQVITPVRLARQTAEKLAAGLLRERMAVRGEDDLARLATSLNQMAGNLQQQIRRLEDLSRMQQRFVSDVSHELRTPLTTVRMASDVLHDVRENFDPGSARAAELLQTELDRFETLLAELLEISRFDAGAAVLAVNETDVGAVVRSVATSLAPLAERRGTQINVSVGEEVVEAAVDVRRVERIVRNLLTNAIDHSERQPIDVRVVADADAVAVGVRDYGVGLEPGQEALVFSRFWRADPARARTSGGTGLGLAIAAEDAALHGGTLQAWGEPGRGSHFVLTLPRHSGIVLGHSVLPVADPEGAPT